MAIAQNYPADRDELAAWLTEQGKMKLPGSLDIALIELGDGSARMSCEISEKHLALNGYLHAASVVALADTAAGFGCIANLPEGANGFTTMELKSNHLGTMLEGTMLAEAQMTHSGRRTQVWDVVVKAEETGKTLALFRCTQMIIYPASD
jgi:uncharacterized protein (TIGR00369 family)